jgi:hypothetical protein
MLVQLLAQLQKLILQRGGLLGLRRSLSWLLFILILHVVQLLSGCIIFYIVF